MNNNHTNKDSNYTSRTLKRTKNVIQNQVITDETEKGNFQQDSGGSHKVAVEGANGNF